MPLEDSWVARIERLEAEYVRLNERLNAFAVCPGCGSFTEFRKINDIIAQCPSCGFSREESDAKKD